VHVHVKVMGHINFRLTLTSLILQTQRLQVLLKREGRRGYKKAAMIVHFTHYLQFHFVIITALAQLENLHSHLAVQLTPSSM
jgi:hypothetical protein